MKRIAASLLALVLLLSLVPFAGADFTDADKIAAENKSAVDYVSGRGVISGFPDGSFKPKDTLTRAQAAKILCVALEGADKANALTKTDTGFTDVAASHWAAKFIAYCVDKGIVAGVGNGRFNPDGQLTAAAFAKMLLVAYNRADAKTLVGEKWAVNTQKAMRADALNDGVNVADKPTTRENACRMAYNFLLDADIAAVEPDAYRLTTISFTDSGKYRLLGRALQTGSGVICDCSGDGVEFTLTCKGTIQMTANVSVKTNSEVTFRPIVDGVKYGQVKCPFVGDTVAYAVLRLQPGEHTIRLVKDTEMTQSADVLKSITLSCKPETMKPTQPKAKLLQVIGDSTGAGFGIMGDSTRTSTQNTASIALSFGYLAAEQLDMDYDLLVKGTTGVINKAGSPAHSEAELYEYRNLYRDENTKYTYPRKADAVVLKVSENDGKFSSEEWTSAVKALFTTIRRIHGDKVPIVLFYYSGSKHQKDVEQFVADDPNVYGVKVRSNSDGAGSHASGKAHIGYAEELVKVLKPLV